MSAAKRSTEQPPSQPVECPEVVRQLVKRFEGNRESYRAEGYNETRTRREFIDPLFEALGWDMENKRGDAEAYKDVIHEDAIKISGATKAPDYCFRIGGIRKFFVEAKKPAANIAEDAEMAYQLRRYAWSAKLPLSILTNFEELAVYDCRVKPAHGDPASKARIDTFPYMHYLTRWGDLAGIFSPEAIRKGLFDRYAESTGRKRGTAEVDDAFLKEIEQWRDLLARNIALRNPQLSQHDLNSAVGLVIDRIIFLRICEDRGIEGYGQLHALLNGVNVYPRLCELFTRADDRYNSGLFHFRRERGRPEPDELTPQLDVDDDTLKEIIKALYYPDSPYEFSVLPADILGQVYEQFLGKVIRLTPGHRAVVDYKPEVKKAGGVYYTPTYIVDYIVEHTVGKLLEGKTPRQVAGMGKGKHPLRVLDPACGSGSFLIGAYQRLLNWHRDWYIAHVVPLIEKGQTFSSRQVSRLLPRRPGEPAMQPVYQMRNGDWRLTTAERKRILLAHIYGVDIDAQAVEVTKLSLLLKVLEGETAESMAFQSRFWHDRALPDLAANIKCGNSLVGPDFYVNHQGNLFGEQEQYRINAFDWQREFPEAFAGREPGFDAVVGNPPYIRIQALKEWAPLEVEYYKKHYVAAGKGNYDIYVVFIEKGLSLLNGTGLQGFIVPHKFLNSQYGQPLRGILAKGRHLSQVVHFGANQVFASGTSYTCLLFLVRAGTQVFSVLKVADLDSWRSNGVAQRARLRTSSLGAAEWNLASGQAGRLLQMLARRYPRLADVADIFVGLQTSADDVYIMDYVGQTARYLRLRSRALGADQLIEKHAAFPLLSGTDVARYAPLPSRQFVLFPYGVSGENACLIDLVALQHHSPKAAQYLVENRKRLAARERGIFRDRDWYRFGRTQNIAIQGRVKLCVPRLVQSLYATYDAKGDHYLDNVDVCGVTLRPPYAQINYLYLLALLNSRLLGWCFSLVSAPFRGGWLSANRQFLGQLPVCVAGTATEGQTRPYTNIVRMAGRMLSLHKQLARPSAPHDKEVIQRQIDAADREIDRLVYELYGLTEKEVAIVEEDAVT